MATLQQQAKALGDPTRHTIYRHIADAPRPVEVAELTEATGLHHNGVRQHLAKLVEAGLISEHTAPPHGPGRPRLCYVVQPTAESRWGVTGSYEQLALLLTEVIRTGDSPEEVGRRAGRKRRPLGVPVAGEIGATPASASARAGAGSAAGADEGAESCSDAGVGRDAGAGACTDAGARAVGDVDSGAGTGGAADVASGRSADHARGLAAEDPIDEMVAEMARTGFEPMVVRHAGGADVTLQTCAFASTAVSDPATVCELHLGLARGVAEAVGGVVVDELSAVPPGTGVCHLRCHLADDADAPA